MASPNHYVVLFYRYFLPQDYPLLGKFPHFYEEKLANFLKTLCQRLELRGRLLVASEGCNGTLSSTMRENLQDFIHTLETMELVRDLGLPEEALVDQDNQEGGDMNDGNYFPFRDVDWKISSSHTNQVIEPFPDLKVSIVKEIISSGGTVSVQDIPRYGGEHLTPRAFHEKLQTDSNVALIDVRNTFEYDIGHFIHPDSGKAARNPQMVCFTQFDQYCEQHIDELRDKTVMMYCTGGIRCEKASAMLKKRGISNVCQLSGGIHRYLEEFGADGFFKGSNFVFDQRIAMKACESKVDDGMDTVQATGEHQVVGRCVECDSPFDELCGSRVCTVCRDLLLVCPACQNSLREYHCQRHKDWKNAYFTFLEVFDDAELEVQRNDLTRLRSERTEKNVRRTLQKQMEKIDKRRQDLATRKVSPEPNAPRRCRTCMDPITICDGRCWGFWKTRETRREATEAMRDISVGDIVVPGPHWNELRLGSPYVVNNENEYFPKEGIVTELKSWATGSTESDCVAVQWMHDRMEPPKIYRWGVVAVNGTRLYDVQREKS